MLGFLGTGNRNGPVILCYVAAGNNIEVSLLSDGIYTALITTVAGLIVGILGYFAYNTLVSGSRGLSLILRLPLRSLWIY